MKKRPILFSGDMVKAILNGSKTQTRRVMKKQPLLENQELAQCLSTTGDRKNIGKYRWISVGEDLGISNEGVFFSNPYSVGMHLWVRETWRSWFPTVKDENGIDALDRWGAPQLGDHWQVRYRADGKEIETDVGWDEGDNYADPIDLGIHIEPAKWRPSIFMPKMFSRILLEITDVSCERVQDISEDDAFAEGISSGDWLGDPVGEFERLWDSINKKRGYGWDKNVWVWVVKFKIIKPEMEVKYAKVPICM